MKPVPDVFRWLVGFFVVALVALSGWMSLQGLAPQDGLAFYTAGELANEGDHELYPTMGADHPVDPPRFRERYCSRFPAAQGPCEAVAIPFVSPPASIPWVRAWALVPYGPAILGIRVLGALCVGLTAAWAAWTAVAGRGSDQGAMGWALGLALIIGLPAAMNPVENGQNSPWLAAAAVLAFVAARRPGPALEVAAALALAGCALFKGSPGVLALLWVYPFRPVALGTFGGALGLSALAAGLTVAPSLWADYAALAGPFASWIVDFQQNGSIDAALRALGLLPDGAVAVFPVAKALIMALAFGLALRAGVEAPGRLALGWAAWLVVSPIVWAHYLWVLWVLVVGLVGPTVRGPGRFALVLWSLCLTPILGLTLGALPLGQVMTAVWLLVGVVAMYLSVVAEARGHGGASP